MFDEFLMVHLLNITSGYDVYSCSNDNVGNSAPFFICIQYIFFVIAYAIEYTYSNNHNLNLVHTRETSWPT